MTHPKWTSLFTSVLLIGTLAFIGTGCLKTANDNGEDGVFTGTLEGWDDVVIPKDAELTRSAFSGPVENHEFVLNNNWDQYDLFTYLEDEMPAKGWTLDYASVSTRNFTREGHLVSYSSGGLDADGSLKFLIIIEPAGTYDEAPADETSPAEVEEITIDETSPTTLEISL